MRFIVAMDLLITRSSQNLLHRTGKARAHDDRATVAAASPSAGFARLEELRA